MVVSPTSAAVSAIDAPAATRNPLDRIAELDRQGVVEALNYPTLASLIEHATADDPELSLAVIHALNQWMLEHWTFNFQDRIFPIPVVTLPIVEKAIVRYDIDPESCDPRVALSTRRPE